MTSTACRSKETRGVWLALVAVGVFSACHTSKSLPVEDLPDTATPDGDDSGETTDGDLDSETDAFEDDSPDEDALDEDTGPDHDLDADDADTSVTDGETDGPDGDVEIDTGPDGPTGPNTCGDGWRDPEWEECDDGIDPAVPTDDRGCTPDCKVLDKLVGANPTGSVSGRWLGIGRHPVAGGIHGHAVVVTELVTGSVGEIRVALYAFSPVGARLGSTSWGPAPLYADPVVAALPNGDYAVAHTSFDDGGDGVGIALVRVSKDGNLATPKGAANTTKVFCQRSPDILWTGKRLVVGWEDESTTPRRVCTRQFNDDMQPLAGEACIAMADSVSRVAFTTLQGELVTTYRVDREKTTTYEVRLPGGGVFATEPLLPPAFDEALALAEIDDSAFLAVYVDGADVMRATIYDYKTSKFRFVSTFSEARGLPTLAATTDAVYLAWWEPSEVPYGTVGWDPVSEELWLQRLPRVGDTLDFSQEPIPLPRSTAHWHGDQVRPFLAPVPLWPTGAVVAAWTDLTGSNYAGQLEHGDVVVQLIPTPVIRTVGGM